MEVICLKFDENGNHITGVHKTRHTQDEVVVRLESRHLGISGSTLNTVLQMVHDGRIEDFHLLLDQLVSFSNEN